MMTDDSLLSGSQKETDINCGIGKRPIESHLSFLKRHLPPHAFSDSSQRL